jgi:hypothetical protein
MFRRILLVGIFAASIVGCSLFVSLDGLTDGGSDASAPDATPQIDAAPDASDASLDAGIDGAPNFVVDDCVPDSTDVVDLTIAGALDWVHWGSDGDTKNVPNHLIGPLLQSSNGDNPYGDDPRMLSWSDGTIVPSVAGTTKGIYDDTGPMTMSVLVSPSRSVMTFYLGTFNTNATWSVALSPGAPASAATVTIAYFIADQFDGGGGNIAMIGGTVSSE